MQRTAERALLGAAAGAAGTTVLNAVTYLDMAARGRPTSSTPEQTVERLSQVTRLPVPGEGEARDNRVAGLGPLTGLLAGVGTGAALGVARAAGWRPSPVLAAAAAAALAMVGTDGPMTALGVTDPRTWPASSWLADLVPHAAYGLATALVLDRLDPVAGPTRGGVAVRALALGLASGLRSTAGPAALVATRGPGDRSAGRPLALLAARRAPLVAAAAALGELVADKLPVTPSRLAPPALAGRLASGALSAAAGARRAGRPPTGPAALGAAGALAGSVLGARWRGAAAARGHADLGPALLEDAATLVLARAGASGPRAGRRRNEDAQQARR